jgi:hypothetical protein
LKVPVGVGKECVFQLFTETAAALDPGKLRVDLLEEELVRAAPLWNSLFQGLDLLGNA